MQLLNLLIVKLVNTVFSLLPLSVLYVIANLIHFLVFRIFKYRKKVVQQNLSNSYPKKTRDEINQITKSYYQYLCDLLVESVRGLSLSKKELQSRFVYNNPEIFDSYFNESRSVILLGSHYGNWEWGTLSFPMAVHHKVVGIYKPLSNRKLDTFLNKLRRQWGLHLTSMKNAGRSIIEHKNIPTIFVLIADQTPVDVKNAHWLNFMHQDTPFLHGADKLARKTNYPVFYYSIKKIKRGYYEVWFENICLNPKSLPPGEITRRYARLLENTINSEPTYWLWSHRRWKRKRPR
ncbi:MAG: lysophospholipid acyltransferase family protein [Bacteroidota bacterium]